jgi:hypothetical protein
MFVFANESNAGAYILDPGTGLVRQDQSGLGSGFGFGW